MTSKTFALLALTLAATGSACAQTVINHSKALAGNVTPGDAAGYPITISTPGHYVLKSNLNVPNGVSGVVIQTEGVTLDLNGYTIGGGRTCTFDYPTHVTSCSASGGLRGVDSSQHMLTLRNGTLRGFDIGVWIYGGLVENVVARYNLVGMFAAGHRPARLTGVMAEYNSQAGLQIDAAGMVDNAVVSLNTVGVFSNAAYGTVRDSMIHFNGTGMLGGDIRSSRVVLNKTDLSGTSSY